MTRWRWLLVATLCICDALTANAESNQLHDRPSFGSPMATYVGNECDAALDAAAAGDGSNQSLNSSMKRIETAFQLITAYGDQSDAEGFREAAFSRQLLRELHALDAAKRTGLLQYLRGHDPLAKLIAFNLSPGKPAAGALALIERLQTERPQELDELPNLAVALAVVRSRSLDEHINENIATADKPLAVFDFYASHESQMSLGLRQMPAVAGIRRRHVRRMTSARAGSTPRSIELKSRAEIG